MPRRWTRRAALSASMPSGVITTSIARRSLAGRARRTRPASSIRSTTRVSPLLLASMRPASSLIRSPPSAPSRWTRTSYERKGMSRSARSSASRMSISANADSRKTRQTSRSADVGRLDTELQREEGRYANTAETGLFLDRGKPTYVGGLLAMANARLYPFWARLTDALRTGEPQNEARAGGDFFGELYADPGRLGQFLHAMTGL